VRWPARREEDEFRRNPRSRREGGPRPREYPMSAKRRLVDTNIIVRYLVQDHEKHAKAAGKLFEACDRGDVEIVVLPAVLAECVFVLESFYEHHEQASRRRLAL